MLSLKHPQQNKKKVLFFVTRNAISRFPKFDQLNIQRILYLDNLCSLYLFKVNWIHKVYRCFNPKHPNKKKIIFCSKQCYITSSKVWPFGYPKKNICFLQLEFMWFNCQTFGFIAKYLSDYYKMEWLYSWSQTKIRII